MMMMMMIDDDDERSVINLWKRPVIINEISFLSLGLRLAN